MIEDDSHRRLERAGQALRGDDRALPPRRVRQLPNSPPRPSGESDLRRGTPTPELSAWAGRGASGLEGATGVRLEVGYGTGREARADYRKLARHRPRDRAQAGRARREGR